MLKILPDMDRNKAEFEKRVDNAKRKAQPKQRRKTIVDSANVRQKWELPDTCTFRRVHLSPDWVPFPRDMSAILLSDLDFENLGNDGTGPSADPLGQVQLSAQVPLKPSIQGRMVERMGTAIIAGFAAAFACRGWDEGNPNDAT